MNEQPLSQEDFDYIYKKVPRLNVEVIIKSAEGIVLSKRAIEPSIGLWHIPGGTVYFEETLEDAVRRIAKAEIGVDVRIDELLGYIEYPELHQNGYFGWPIGIAFLVSVIGGTTAHNFQSSEIQFFHDIPEDTITEQKDFLRNHVLNDRNKNVIV